MKLLIKGSMYKVKTVFTGYKIGLMDPNIYIGIPHKYFFDRNGNEHFVLAEYEGIEKQLFIHDSVISKTFNDRFVPGEKYTLFYFLWEKVDQGEVKDEKS